MKILLVHPQQKIHRRSTRIYGRYARYAPLTMPTLAALAPADLHASVQVVDEMVEELDTTTTADLVGITCITGTANRAYELADQFRRRGATVVLGGIHPTLVPAEAARHADSVVTGYAEDSWPRLLRDFAAGRLQPLYAPPPGLPRFVRPNRSFIRRRLYGAPDTVEAMRGCGNKCEFCVSRTMTPDPVPRPVDDVMDEIRGLPGRLVSFLDPNLVADIPYALELFGRLRSAGKWWVGCVTADVLGRPGLLDSMAASGCRGLLIGFDSLDQQALNGIAKNHNVVSDFERTIREIHARGILITGCFIVGFDTDDASVFPAIAAFVRRTGIDVPHFTLFTPYPGTAARARLEAEGRITSHDWSLHDGRHVVFEPARMSAGQLRDGYDGLWRAAYGAGSMLQRLGRRPFPAKLAAAPTNLQIRRFRRRCREVET